MKPIDSILNQINSSESPVSNRDLQKVFDYITKEEVDFTGDVNLLNSNTKYYKSYNSEEDAIDDGLQVGDIFILNNEEVVITKTKQVITLQANLAELIAFTVDISHLTPAQFYTEYFGSGTLSLVTYDTSFKFYTTGNDLNTLSDLKIGLGYSITFTSAKTLTIYGKPVNPSYHYPIHSGINYIGWADVETPSTTALSLFSGTPLAYITIEAGVTIVSPSTFKPGRAYQINTLTTTSEQGLPKLIYTGDTKVDFSFIDEASAIASGLETGQLWYDTTYGIYRTLLT
jgi:hypothetical protein